MTAKLYYTPAEVCEMIDVKPTSLRAWERDFPQLRPKRSKTGVRLYKEKDIELVKYIRHLLVNEKYTVDGAKQRIALERRAKRRGVEVEVESKSKDLSSPDLPDLFVQDCDDDFDNAVVDIKAQENSELLKTVKNEIVEMLEILKKQS